MTAKLLLRGQAHRSEVQPGKICKSSPSKYLSAAVVLDLNVDPGRKNAKVPAPLVIPALPAQSPAAGSASKTKKLSDPEHSAYIPPPTQTASH